MTDTYQIAVERRILHERYLSRTPLHNDIALVRLARPATLNDNVRPVCLPLAEGDASQIEGLGSFKRLGDVTGRVLGWGRTRYNSAGDLLVSVKGAFVLTMYVLEQ